MTENNKEENKHYLVMVPPGKGEPLINISALFEVLKRSKYIIIVAALIVGGLMALRAYYATPKYQVSAILVIKNVNRSGLGSLKNQYGGLAAMAGIDLGDGGGKDQEYYAILSSKKMVREFLEKNALLRTLFAGDWDEANKTWKADTKKIPNYNIATIFWLKNIMFFSKDRKTGIIGISLNWRNPQIAKKWLSDYIAFANEVLRVENIALAEKTIAYLKAQAQQTQLQGIRSVIFSLMESQINQVMMAKLQSDFAFKVIDPPIAPEVENYIRPRPILEIILGLILGAGLASAIILFRQRKRIFNPLSKP